MRLFHLLSEQLGNPMPDRLFFTHGEADILRELGGEYEDSQVTSTVYCARVGLVMGNNGTCPR